MNQAERINSSNSPVLQYSGGAVSPEMQPPKVCCQLVMNLDYSMLACPNVVIMFVSCTLNTDMLLCIFKVHLE